MSIGKVPVVGRILDKVEVEFTIHYWKGSWNKKWEPWFQNEHPWTDGLPRGTVFTWQHLTLMRMGNFKSFLNGGQNK